MNFVVWNNVFFLVSRISHSSDPSVCHFYLFSAAFDVLSTTKRMALFQRLFDEESTKLNVNFNAFDSPECIGRHAFFIKIMQMSTFVDNCTKLYRFRSSVFAQAKRPRQGSKACCCMLFWRCPPTHPGLECDAHLVSTLMSSILVASLGSDLSNPSFELRTN